LTDDVANRQKAEKEALKCVSVRRYVEGMKESSKLIDLLSAAGSDQLEPTKAVAARQVLYPDYLPMSTLLAGVKSGQLHQGHFNANQYNYLEVGGCWPLFPVHLRMNSTGERPSGSFR